MVEKGKTYPKRLFEEPTIECPNCGMKFKGAMYYSCPKDPCPVQPKVRF